MKTGAFEAAILIFSIVDGLMPSLAGLSLTLNVPKPTNETLSPATIASVSTSVNALHAFSASLRESPVLSATAPTNSDFFMILPP